MLNVMYSRYILTIAAFVIILLIDILYFTKPKISNKSKHKMFAFLISANTAILVLELAVMCVFGLDLSFTIGAIVLHLRDLSMVVFFSCLLFYYYSAVSDVRYYSLSSIFRDSEFKLLRPHLILTFIFVIVQFFLPYDVVDKNSFSVAWGGIAFYATIVYCVITTLETIFMIIFVVKKSINNSEKASLIWLFSIMMVILIFQPVFSGVAIMGICSAIYVLGLYFLLENPDLEMVEIIEALTEEVEQTNKSKSDFLSSVSKKMITPASSISELTEKVLNSEEWNNDEVKENLTQINHLSKEFLEVLDNAVDVSNAENDQNVLNENEYSLSALLRDLITSTKEKIANKRIELILHIDTSTPNTLYGDATKVYQVLSNVLTNSAKYNDNNEIMSGQKFNVYFQTSRGNITNILYNYGITIDKILKETKDCKIKILDFHAEATSEKKAMGFYLDGRISAMFGTHTHVPTADETILSGGTGYITDVGMTGAVDSVIGVKKDLIIAALKDKMPVKFEFAEGKCRMDCIVFEINEKTGQTVSVKRLSL